jgi:hypothetical protein
VVIEIENSIIDEIKHFNTDVKNFILEAIREKIEDMRDYELLKRTRGEREIDFEEFLENENNN